MKPNILDPRFKYVPAASTDIRKTFAKARKQIEARKKSKKGAMNHIAFAAKADFYVSLAEDDKMNQMFIEAAK